jgi:protein-tyrosine phosphatase
MNTPSRSVALQGATNFRDLGGYTGHAGRPVRWRKLFRSDHLGALTAEDLSTLAPLGLSQVLDFRGRKERSWMPSRLPATPVHSLAIEPTVVQRIAEHEASGTAPSAQDTVHLMNQTYRAFVQHNTPQFAQLFAQVLQADAPVVFHCTAGKDRTGLAAALLLHALGVDEATVMQDYLLTNQLYRVPAHFSSQLPQAVAAVLWGVQPVFLEAAFAVIQEQYGGVDNYLHNGLGLNAAQRDRLRAAYLES